MGKLTILSKRTWRIGEVVKHLKLQIDLGMNLFKVVNLEVEKVVGLAHQFPLTLGKWIILVDFIVIPLDDFDIILGQEFMKKEKEASMPHLDCLEFLT